MERKKIKTMKRKILQQHKICKGLLMRLLKQERIWAQKIFEIFKFNFLNTLEESCVVGILCLFNFKMNS
jgi:hypothetical protein